MSNSPSHSDAPSPPTSRPNQGTFCNEEQDFLKGFLPQYRSLLEDLSKVASGPRALKGTKGRKKNWVINTVFPKFVSHFDSAGANGPNLDSLKTAMARWFSNRTNGSDTKNPASVTYSSAPSTSKPRAVTAVDLFAKDHASDIKQQMVAKRAEEGTTPKESNLAYHREIKSQMFNDSDDATKAKYQVEAASLNTKLRSPPEASEIYRNQQDVLHTSSAALRSLCGWDWGQHGDLALFLVGAFRDEEKRLKLFHVSVADNPDADFPSTLSDFGNNVRKPFKAWALSVLPAIKAKAQPSSSAPVQPSIKIGTDGYPTLPVLGEDSITPKLARDLLKDFLSSAWDLAVRSHSDSEPLAIPWDAMSLAQRSVYLAADVLPSFPDLDPTKMSRESAYSLFEAFLASQLKQERPIEFSISEEALDKLRSADEASDQQVDDEIVELYDPPTPRSKSRKTSPQKEKASPIKMPGQLVDFSLYFDGAAPETNQSTVVTLAHITSPPTPVPSTGGSAISINATMPSATVFTATTSSALTPTPATTNAKSTPPTPCNVPGITCMTPAVTTSNGKAAVATAKRKSAPVKAKPKKDSILLKANNSRKRKADEGEVDMHPAPKKKKAPGPKFSPRKPSARIRNPDYAHKSVTLPVE